jgi:hypothetical protein
MAQVGNGSTARSQTCWGFCALSRGHLNAMSREVQGKVDSDFTDADIIP